MSKIVLEDFNEGNGYYKVNLAYLNKKQVEEIEALVSTWSPTDEDIKSCIQMCLTDTNEQRFNDYGTNLKDCLAWLEKQGKSNPYSGVSFEYNGNIWGMCARDNGVDIGLNGEFIQHVSIVKQDEKKPVDVAASVAKSVSDAYPTFDLNGFKERFLSEEKSPAESLDISPKKYEEIVNECIYSESVDKVEPKFHESNWYQCTKDFFGKGVTFDKNTTYYCAKEGCLQNEYGCHIAIVKDLYDNFKLWTIKDAKDGDVLALSYASQNYILIYKKLYEKNFETMMSVFCFYCVEEDTYYDGTDSFHVMNCGEIITPATKEQRDLLFAKMKDAGYEWDAEKKELKKIEQKLKWSKEDDANKVEPKFHKGDWIISKYMHPKYMHLVMQILNNDKGFYKTVETNGTVRNDSYDYIDRNFKLWSIEDAKDSDVLVSHFDIPFIYNGNYNSDYLGAYCGITTGGDFSVSTEKCQWTWNKNIHPATKEQRELLYKKMMESWEMWNIKEKNIIGENINYIWHSALEEPDEQREIFVEYEREDVTKHKVVYYYEVVFYHKDTDSFLKDSFIITDVTKWCYFDELIKHMVNH